MAAFVIVWRPASLVNPSKPEFNIVIFIHYKPPIAITILDLLWIKIIKMILSCIVGTSLLYFNPIYFVITEM